MSDKCLYGFSKQRGDYSRHFLAIDFWNNKKYDLSLMIAMERLWGERCFIEYLCWCDMLINLGLFYLSLEHWSYDVLKCEKLHNHVSFFVFL